VVVTDRSGAEQAIDCDDAAKLIREALGVESDDEADYVFPKTWPADRERRAAIVGEWPRAEARTNGTKGANFIPVDPQVKGFPNA
jgi:hypothetical protein